MSKTKATPARKSRASDRHLDRLTVERVGAIMDAPDTPAKIKQEAARLAYALSEATDAFQDADDPHVVRGLCGDGLIAVRPLKSSDHRWAEAKEARAALITFAERHEPEEHKIARRCAEIYAEELSRSSDGKHHGAYYFATAVDEVTTNGSDQLMPDPRSEFFVPVFVKAARELGRRDRRYVEVKKLIARVEAGESLAEMHAERERHLKAWHAEQERKFANGPEPTDKLSDDWRYWKLRRFEQAFREGSEATERERAGQEFHAVLRFVTADHPVSAYTARQLLPHLLIAQQTIWAEEKDNEKGKGEAA